jgi:hypothetical protein
VITFNGSVNGLSVLFDVEVCQTVIQVEQIRVGFIRNGNDDFDDKSDGFHGDMIVDWLKKVNGKRSDHEID